MNPWEQLARPLVERPGHAYTESLKRKRPLPKTEQPPTLRTKPKKRAGEFIAAALIVEGRTATLAPITVCDFYAEAA